MKKLIITVILILSATAAFAQLAAPQAPRSPVKIQADAMQYYGNENKSSFNGQVVAVSDEYTLTADNVDVFFTPTNDVNQINCNGNVNFKSTDILAVANRAELDQMSKTIKLNGNVKIWQGENYLEGESVNIQYDTKEIAVDRQGGAENGGGRVMIIFGNPEDLGDIQ